MEQLPQSNENNELERPILSLDLSGPDGNVYAVISQAHLLLEGNELEAFRQEIQVATAPGAGKRYEDILAIVNSHVELIDTSNLYPEYGNKKRLTAAVERLNEQLLTLPDTVSCYIDGPYPECSDPDYGPDEYLALLRYDVERVEQAIEQSDENQREPLERFRAMLLECARVFRRAGML